jgi:dTDP-glucose pyrophosphorylase
MNNLDTILLTETDTIRDAITSIDRSAKGIALVVDTDRRLLYTITDGDIRRAILRSVPVTAPLTVLNTAKKGTPYELPASAPANSDTYEQLRIMQARRVRQLPLVDDAGRVVGLVTMDELLPAADVPLDVVIMAGGKGTRLMPLTADTPKPMLPVGGKPLLERIIDQLRAAGVNRVHIATHQLREKITGHFGDGATFGVAINYLDEESPLGTAGALSLLERSQEPILVINGDVLTRVDFRAMREYHRKQEAEMTIGVRQYGLPVPYGVVESEGPVVRGLREKPTMHFLVNAGIYILEPAVLSEIAPGTRCDMTDIIQSLLIQNRRVVSFPVVEYWLDIGQHADYQRAQTDVAERGWDE